MQSASGLFSEEQKPNKKAAPMNGSGCKGVNTMSNKRDPIYMLNLNTAIFFSTIAAILGVLTAVAFFFHNAVMAIIFIAFGIICIILTARAIKEMKRIKKEKSSPTQPND